jgi:uncharacterized membrane protein YhhN
MAERAAKVLSVLCLLAVAGLLWALAAGEREAAMACKPLASAAFVGVAVALGVRGAYGRRVLVGLCLAAGGDVALMLPGEGAFLAGLVLFLLGHLCYAWACAARARPRTWPSLAAVPVVLVSAAAYAWLWPHLGPMRWPVLGYVLAITLMVTGALAAGRRDGPDHRLGQAPGPGRWLLPAGAILFYLSDLSVARNRFVAPGYVNVAWGLPAYYLGQLLLAWSTR